MSFKILFAEDDPNIGSLTAQYLESEGYEVKLCASGGNVVDEFEKFKPDICLLDVMLPIKDGFSIGKEIRDLNSSMPIIFITAKSQLKDVLVGFESGANDYIKKPFSLEELKARLKSLLAFAPNTESQDELNEFEIGKYSFNYRMQSLKIDDHEDQLSPKESDLLKELCLNIHGRMDKSVALKKIWGDDTFYNGRSMDVYITKIRKYLLQDPAIEIINLRGIGYKLMVRD
jgi:two-component system, OmpR family, response regulator